VSCIVAPISLSRKMQSLLHCIAAPCSAAETCLIGPMKPNFETRAISEEPDVVAPDGSDVRLLAAASRGSMAHFELAPGQVAKAVRHKTVEELWFITAGVGEMWRKGADGESVVELHPGLSLSIPLGTAFQFRNTDDEEPLEAVAVTMPPWPGEGEAELVPGKWQDD
jgi:mannose-6-phosphate isomerase-like protein (cupin superfamily)